MTARAASRRSHEVLAIRLPLEERARVEALAAELGESRSRLLRAAFASVEHQPPDVLRVWIATLPGGGGRA